MPETLYPPAPPEQSVDCEDCGESVTEPDEVVTTAEGYDVCPLCAEDMVSCDECERPTNENTEAVTGGYVCHSCAQYMGRCSDCNRRGHWDAMNTVHDCREVCDDCVDNAYWHCSGCESLIHQDNGEYCYDCASSSGGLINDYSYTPHLEFHGTGPMYLGLELEVEVSGSLSEPARIALNHLGNLGYLKEDGSLSHGFEIVTHPMSHEYARQNFPFGMLRELQNEGCETTEETGLHVHVSRKAFDGPAHVYRWLKMIHRNQDSVIGIARRESDSWAPFSHYDRRRAKYHAKGDRDDSRYAAINCTNYATFEIRVFKSSLNGTEVMAALDLVAASVEYTRTLTVQDIVSRDGWDWDAFGSWVAERPAYLALAREMELI